MPCLFCLVRAGWQQQSSPALLVGGLNKLISTDIMYSPFPLLVSSRWSWYYRPTVLYRKQKLIYSSYWISLSSICLHADYTPGNNLLKIKMKNKKKHQKQCLKVNEMVIRTSLASVMCIIMYNWFVSWPQSAGWVIKSIYIFYRKRNKRNVC